MDLVNSPIRYRLILPQYKLHFAILDRHTNPIGFKQKPRELHAFDLTNKQLTCLDIALQNITDHKAQGASEGKISMQVIPAEASFSDLILIIIQNVDTERCFTATHP